MLNHGSIESKSYISKSLFKITVLWHSYVTFKQNTFLPMILICSIYLHNNWITYWVFNKPPGLIAKLCPTLVTPWAVAPQTPPSVGFPRQKYWSGLPFPSPGDLPDPGIEPRSPMLQADSFFFFFFCRQILYQLSRRPQTMFWGFLLQGTYTVFPLRLRNLDPGN